MCDAPAIKACSLGSFRRILDSAVAQSSLRPRWVWKPLSLFQSPQRSGCESCWQALCAPTADCGGHFVDWFWYQGLAVNAHTCDELLHVYIRCDVQNAINVYTMVDAYWTGHASRIHVVHFTFYGRRHSATPTPPVQKDSKEPHSQRCAT